MMDAPANSTPLEPGQRLPLDAFLAARSADLEADLGAEADRIQRVTGYLISHLNQQPELATQTQRLANAVPHSIATAAEADRLAALDEARHLAQDIKDRWVKADNPPLVEEIDDRLADIAKALETLRRPGPEAIRAAAADIDRLSRQTRHLEDIEQRYIPWGIGAGLLFVFGIWILVNPALLAGTPLASFWTIIFCLGALPATGVHYSRKVLPRSRADHEIDQLNRKHFVPLGGLYFPEGQNPAAVVTIPPPPRQSEGDQARAERRGHRDKAPPAW